MAGFRPRATPKPHRLRHRRGQAGGGDRLVGVAVHAGPAAGFGIGRERAGGETDDRHQAHRRRQAADLPGGGEAVHLGHHHVHQHEVDAARADRATAWRPSATVATRCPWRSRMRVTTRRLVALSSATRIDCGGTGCGSDGGAGAGRAAVGGAAGAQHGFEVEYAALAEPAGGGDGAAHRRRQTLADGEPEPAAAVAARDRAVALHELREQAGDTFGCDADAGVGHAELQPHRAACLRLGSATHATATRTEPCSVNFTALPTRLSSTWRRRAGSPPARTGISGATASSSARPLARADALAAARSPSG